MFIKYSTLNSLFFFSLLAIFSAQCFAIKKDNDAPVDQKYAVKIASVIVERLAKGKKIDESWNGVKAKSAIVRQYPHGKEWVIAFRNPKIKRQSNRILYIFLTLSGKYVAVNYTGQ